MRWPKWGLAVLVALAGLSFWVLLAGRLAWATPIATAHLLVFALVCHTLVEYAAKVVAHRRRRRA